jgi:hypothetical protein
MSRAQSNGIVTGKLVETAFFFKTYSLDATDMIHLILTNDGSFNSLMPALVASGSTYTAMGSAYGHKVGCRMNASEGRACDVVLSVIAAEGFTNN